MARSKRLSIVTERLSYVNYRLVVCIFDRDEDEYRVGFDMKILPNGKHSEEPYGCRTYTDREEALDEVSNMVG